jgi:hypothetical protein
MRQSNAVPLDLSALFVNQALCAETGKQVRQTAGI